MFSKFCSIFTIACLLMAVGGTAFSGEEAKEPVVKEIEVKGAITMSPAQVRGKMGTRVGQPLDSKILDEDFQRLSSLESVADVQIKREVVDGGVKLIVHVREKDVIKRIQYLGNSAQKTANLEKLIKSKVGDRYDAGQVNRDVRAIQDSYQEDFFYFTNVTTRVEPFEDGVRLVFDVEEGGRMYVKKIEFRGNNSFRPKELFKFMETRSSTLFTRGKYDRDTFEKDLERLRMFYQSKGFLDVKVSERPFEIAKGVSGIRKQMRSDATIFIDIEEGEQYKVGRVDFEGNNLVSEEKLRAVVETVPGDVFSPVTAQKDANTIRDIYGKEPSSRYFTKVFGDRVYSEKGAVVDVVFKIKEGEEVIVEDVQIVGLTKTQDRVVRRLIEQMPGEKIDSTKINYSKQNLHNTGYFKSMNFEVKPGSDPQKRAKLVVDLEEQSTGKLVLGAGFSSSESFVGSIQLQQRNFDSRDWPKHWKDLLLGKAFCGGGQTFDVNIASGSESQNYKFDFLEPWFFDRPIRFGLGGFYKANEWDDYDEERLGGYFRLGKRLFENRNLDASATFKFERVTLSEFDDSVSQELQNEEGTAWINRVAFNITYDTRDSRFDPTKGLMLSATQEFATSWLGSEKEFWRSFGEVNFLHPVWKDKSGRPWVFALRADVAMGEAFGDDDRMPVYERFYAGGIGSLRGFEYRSVSPRDSNGDEVGGELRNTYSAEFFIPVYEKLIRASAFYDIGAVWADLDDMDGDPWRSSCGIGLHVQTPLSPMPIRLYWTHALDEVDNDETESFQFTFGAFF